MFLTRHVVTRKALPSTFLFLPPSQALQAIQYKQATIAPLILRTPTPTSPVYVCPSLQAIQYVQANPDEVCPAGWKPGQKTMKPDPKVGYLIL